jgi:hypothetical protein
MSSRASFERFRASTPQDIEAMTDGMFTVVGGSRYRAGTDAALIPLDTTVQNFNGWKAKAACQSGPEARAGSGSTCRATSVAERRASRRSQARPWL